MKKRSGLYDYLEQTGVLETGTDEDIRQAKKAYWAQVRKTWKAQQRKECKGYTVFLTKSELNAIRGVIGKHTGITTFIKQAALQTAKNGSGINKHTVGMIREAFFQTYGAVEQACDELPKGPGSNILKQFCQLEQTILRLLTTNE